MLLRISALFIFVFILVPLGWLRRTTGLSSFGSKKNTKVSAWDMKFKAQASTPQDPLHHSGRDDAQVDLRHTKQWQP